MLSTNDKRRILDTLLAFATAVQAGEDQRAVGVGSQLDGCAGRGITW